MIKLLNKRGGSLHIGILVFMTLLLVITTLFLFSVENKDVNKNLEQPLKVFNNFIDKENALDIYLQDAVLRSARHVGNIDEFGANLNAILSGYQEELPEFSEEMGLIRLGENRVIGFTNGKYTLSTSILIKYSNEGISIEKNYFGEFQG